MDETRARFLTEIVGRLGAERIVELHLFTPIRQGSTETGVAVVAVTPGAEQATVIDDAVREAPVDAADAADAAEAGEADDVEADPAPAVVAEEDAESPYLEAAESPVDARLVVHTARYRLVRKGPDRGKWLVEVTATADAPLATVDAVARGVTQRAKDLTEAERFSGEQLRALLEDPVWRTPT